MKTACQAMIVAGLFMGLSFVVAFGLALADTSDWRASLAVMRGDELIVPARIEGTAHSDGLIAIPIQNLGVRSGHLGKDQGDGGVCNGHCDGL